MRPSQASIKSTSSVAAKPTVLAMARRHRAGEAVARGARGSAAAGCCCGALHTELNSAARSRVPLCCARTGSGPFVTAGGARRLAGKTSHGTKEVKRSQARTICNEVVLCKWCLVASKAVEATSQAPRVWASWRTASSGRPAWS
jgi:hypothetical protein